MFGFARALMRHKVGVVAVAAFAVFVFAGRGQETVKAANPWSVQPAAATSGDSGFTARLGAAASSASDYAAEKVLGDKDLNPVRMGEQTVQHFDQTSEAFKSANGN